MEHVVRGDGQAAQALRPHLQGPHLGRYHFANQGYEPTAVLNATSSRTCRHCNAMPYPEKTAVLALALLSVW